MLNILRRIVATPTLAATLLGLVLSPTPSVAQAAGDGAAAVVREYREGREASLLADYAELLRYPNVARDLRVAANLGAVRTMAEVIVAELEALDVPSRLLELDGAPPFVYGRLDVPGATRTLGIYLHYDGQPVDRSRWVHDPWTPTLYSASMDQGGEPIPFPTAGEPVDPDWRIYARSASDDKAPLGALLPVLRAFRESGIAPTSNLVFFFEGEEEAGSPNLRQFLRTYRELLDPVDLWLFFDGPMHQSGQPQLSFGVRGTTGMELTVFGASRSLHSGHYGNWAPDTPMVLADLLRSMKDPYSGEVLVEGWYDSAEPLSDAAEAAIAGVPPVEDGLMRELGILWTEGGGRAGDPGAGESLARRLTRPALTIRGITAGNTGALTRNVIPNQATASIGIRLVRGNDPERMKDLVEAHIRGQGFHIVREVPDAETRLAHPRIAMVRRSGGYRAASTPLDNPALRQVVETTRAAADAAYGPGSLVLLPTLGGSLPLYLFEDELGKPWVNVNVANHDNNQHAANENLRVGNLWYAMELYARLLTMPAPVS
jgi:acetylornithine deacetylase/succinyl-diaminopimelate desuccinylase-like protein